MLLCCLYATCPLRVMPSNDFFLYFFYARVAQLTGYEPQDLIEKTLYQYIHAADILQMRYSHQICKYRDRLLLKYVKNIGVVHKPIEKSMVQVSFSSMLVISFRVSG